MILEKSDIGASRNLFYVFECYLLESEKDLALNIKGFLNEYLKNYGLFPLLHGVFGYV